MILKITVTEGTPKEYNDFGDIFSQPMMRPAKGETVVSNDGREYEITKVRVQNIQRPDTFQSDIMWEYFLKEIPLDVEEPSILGSDSETATAVLDSSLYF